MIISASDGAPCGSLRIPSFLFSPPFLISPTFPSILSQDNLGQWQLEYPQRKEEDCQSTIKCRTKRSPWIHVSIVLFIFIIQHKIHILQDQHWYILHSNLFIIYQEQIPAFLHKWNKRNPRMLSHGYLVWCSPCFPQEYHIPCCFTDLFGFIWYEENKTSWPLTTDEPLIQLIAS